MKWGEWKCSLITHIPITLTNNLYYIKIHDNDLWNCTMDRFIRLTKTLWHINICTDTIKHFLMIVWYEKLTSWMVEDVSVDKVGYNLSHHFDFFGVNSDY